MESLESRRLFNVILKGDTLTVTGSDLPDNINLFVTDQGGNLPDLLHVVTNGHEDVFNQPGIQHVFVSALGGDDVVKVYDGLAETTASPFTVAGGAGDDSLTGDTGDATIFGGHGNDTIFGGGGDGIYAGGAGNDLLVGDHDNAFGNFHGGPGNDLIRVAGEQEDVQGDSGRDTLDFSLAFEDLDISLDGIDNDGFADPVFRNDVAVMHIVGDFERIIGGPNNDRISGDDTSELILGGGGNDTIHGGGGNDTIVGGAGHDKLFGDAGDDSLIGKEPSHATQLRDTLDGGGDSGDVGDAAPPDILRNLKTR